MCKWFLKYATKIQNGRQRSTQIFLWAQKLQNSKSEIIQILLQCITFPTIWRFASDFSRFYWNLKWPPWINFIFFVGTKTERLKSVIIHIVQSHYSPSKNVHVIHWNLKWPPQINFLNIRDRKKSNLIYGGDDTGIQASCFVCFKTVCLL